MKCISDLKTVVLCQTEGYTLAIYNQPLGMIKFM